MSTFTLVTNRRSRRPNRDTSRHQPRRQQNMPTTRTEFRRQFPTHHDRENHYAPAAAAPRGAWGQKLRVNTSENAEFAAKYRRAQNRTQPRAAPATAINSRPCAYCKEDGHHIRYCQKAAAATAKKQEWKRKEKARRAAEKKNLAEERLRQRILAAQQTEILAQQPVVEEESDSSSDSDNEEQPETSLSRDDQIAELVAKIAELRKEEKNASWADAADLEDEIEELEAKLDDLGYTPEERMNAEVLALPEVSFQSRLATMRAN